MIKSSIFKHAWKVSRRHLLLSLCLGLCLPLLSAQAQNNNNNNNIKTTNTTTPKVQKVQLNIPALPRNALTPADKNFGGTSIYLVDQKSAQKQRRDIGKPGGSSKNQLNKPAKIKGPDTVIINSGEDAQSNKLAPLGYEQNNDKFKLSPAIYLSPAEKKNATKLIPVALQGSASVTLYVIQVDPSRSDFYAFTQDGQSVNSDLLGKGNPIVVGTKGTVISTNENLITLHDGNILVDTGNKPVRVGNREMGAKIPANSTVLVEYTPGQSMRIVPLSLKKGQSVQAKAAARQNETFNLEQDEALILDVNGTYKKKLSIQSIEKDSPVLRTSNFSMQKYARLRAHLINVSKVSNSENSHKSEKAQVPGKPLRVMAAEGSEFYVNENGELVLNAGWLCVDAQNKAIISTDLGKVYIKKPAFVNVEQIPGYFRVANCSQPGAVFVTHQKYGVPLAEGEEILFCDHTPSAAEIAAGDGLLRRQLKASPLEGGGYAIYGEFSIYSMLYNATHLKPLRLAANSENKHKLNELIHTLSKIQFSTGSRGDYSEAPNISGSINLPESETSTRLLSSKE